MSEDLWFEPSGLLSRCSLNEGLLWVWAERVPLHNVYREKNVFDTLEDWECEHLGIPPVPPGIGRGAQYRTEERERTRDLGKMTKDARAFWIKEKMEEAAVARQWLPAVTAAMDLAVAEFFPMLRRGQIQASGKLLPDGAEIIDFLEGDNSYGRNDFDDLVDSVIPPEFWTLSGIDWLANAVKFLDRCYCDVSMSVEDLMRLYPGERTPVTAEFVGNCLLVRESAERNVQQTPQRRLGRPTVFAWEAFHVEVADLIRNEQMPRKKEAAIHHMLDWFETQGGQKPSRSAVSEKLTPYYRKFFADKG